MLASLQITELELEGFKDKLSSSKLDYPKSDNKNLFNLFYNMIAVASRGGGKTYSVVKIIKEYEKNFKNELTLKKGNVR